MITAFSLTNATHFKCKIVNDDGKLYITGFFNKRFFLLDFQTRVEVFTIELKQRLRYSNAIQVMSVACGGGKRSWDVRVFSDQRLFGFIRMETFQMAFLDDAVTGGSRLLKVGLFNSV